MEHNTEGLGFQEDGEVDSLGLEEESEELVPPPFRSGIRAGSLSRA